jgi:hypothetical protein
MKIEELFNMPINEMKDWMTQHLKKVEPEVKYEYAYFDMFDLFDLEKDYTNWRPIPVMSTCWCKGNSGSIFEYMRREWEDMFFGVAKKSKYGELLIYVFKGNWYYDNEDQSTYYGDRHFELEKIFCNDYNSNEYCHCFVEGPDVVNDSRLCVYLCENDMFHDHKNTWLKAFPWLDEHESVLFKTTPTIGGVNKNKHTINEFNDKLEKFAKNVMESNEAFTNVLNAVPENELEEKCKFVDIQKNYVIELWRALFVENNTITIDDVVGIIRLSQSKEQLVIDYRTAHKCPELKYETYDKRWNIVKSYYGPSPYHLSRLFDNKAYVDTPSYLGYLKDIEKTRALYKSLDNYKDTVANAKKEYREKFEAIAEEFELSILEAYKLASDKLKHSRDTYLSKTKYLYELIHEKYEGVNDSDIGVFEDIKNIIDPIKDEFIRTSKKVMRQLKPSYKKNEKKETERKTSNFSNEFINHVKIMFDTVKDVDKIPFFAEGKGYDAPYEQYERDFDLGDRLGDDVVYEFEEKFGQGSFDEWCAKFFELCPHYNVDCDEVYPGWTIFYYIDRNFEEITEEED